MYGSFRALLGSTDGHTTLGDSFSRWGIKGSSEVSEGLTAVYHYEEALDLGTATLSDGNRLSYVGLSGGFGSISAGRLWSATYNHTGDQQNQGIHYGGSAGLGTGRISNTLSYSAATGPVSFQLDLQMLPDGTVVDTKTGMTSVTGRSVDMTQFGMTVDTGFAKVGIATKNLAYAQKPVVSTKATANDPNTKADETTENLSTAGEAAAMNNGKKLGDKKVTSLAFTVPLGDFSFYGAWNKLTMKQNGMDDSDKKLTTTGFSGPLGDTGLKFGVNFMDIDNKDDLGAAGDDGTNPWDFHISKPLGGGAQVDLEHANADNDADDESSTGIRLKIDF